jgi:diguanylate cyclase (GGDEF)-like protein/PAS domain S-box-containing protein
MALNFLSCVVLMLVALVSGLPGRALGAAPDAAGTEPRHVLVLLSYHHGHSWEDDILRGFSVWDGPPAQRPVLHIEWMDTKRYPSAQYRQRYQKFLDEKYAGRNFDLLVAVDDLALIQAANSPAWRNTPIVFSGINGDPVALVGQRGRATGIAERYEVGHTLAMALSLHQHTRRLVFLTAADESGVGNRETIGRALAELPAETKARLTIEHWTPTSLDKVDSQLSALSDGSLLFALGSLPVTESGRPLSNEQLVAYVRGKTQRPVYSDTDRSVGEGAVGGYVNSGFENGRLMAKMARRILAGEDAESLPIVYETPQVLLVDFNELKRFGLSVESLPAGAVVLNSPPSIFDPEHRATLNGGIAAILVLILVLAGLVVRARFNLLRIQSKGAAELRVANEALMRAKAAETEILGGSIERVYAEIAALGSNRTAQADDAARQREGSILEQVALTREKLTQLDAERMRNEASLRLSAAVFEYSGEGIMITDADNCIVAVNAAFTRLTGYTLDEIRGANPRILSAQLTPPETFQAMWRALLASGHWQGELWDRAKDGHVYPKWVSISLLRNSAGDVTNHIASFVDMSERKSAEEHISRLAHHDSLTGLFNRYSLHERLEQALLTAQREGNEVAVILIDMDRFKSINDTLGHQAGDAVLIEIAQRLQDTIRESDIIARFGGDEFIIALTGVESGMRSCASIVSKIQHRLGQPYAYQGKLLHSTPSIGLSIFPTDGNCVETLLKHADIAMYAAKAQGRNTFQFFSSAMNDGAVERMLLEQELRAALEREEFVLHYQPQVCAADGRISGLEALVRWQHPQNGLISPMKFIPVAEEIGLIEKLGAWVLNEACRQLASWNAEGVPAKRVAVNLSAHQLRSPDLVDLVRTTMNRHGIGAGALELEVTESVAMADPQRATDTLKALRELGVALAIDDFGTGYSSLAYLKLLPIQTLKLDRAFVKDIETDENDATICIATLALAHSLGLEVVAEGVETLAQRSFLVSHRCDILQGFLISQPLPVDEAAAFLRAL